MSRISFTGRLLPAGLLTLACGSMLSSCDRQPPASETPPASTAAPASDTTADQQLKAREQELAQREAAVADKERELQLAQREATVAASEQDLARQKEADAAAAKAAAKVAAAKASAAKAATAKELAAKSSAATKSASGGSSTPAKPAIERVGVPSGTPMSVALSSDLSSKTAKPGDRFEATLASNVSVNGRVVVPIGTRVTGQITQVISGSRAIGAMPVLGLQFNQIELEDGQIIPITGELTQQGSSEKVQDTAKILGGVAAGAVLGHQVKTNNSGKVVGGLLGGAIGAIAARNTGTEVQLAAGSTLALSTGEPFAVNVHAASEK
jgi:type IV secretory pathway VirB10-like protein